MVSDPRPPAFPALSLSQATRTGMFAAVAAGLAVSYTLVAHGQALLQLFLGGNAAGVRGRWNYRHYIL